jgi:hypothetical protein
LARKSVATDSADVLYEEIRQSESDVDNIAFHTGLTRRNIARIKAHLFMSEHLLDSYVDLGVPAEWAKFDADMRIAEAWNPLRAGKHGLADMQLLKHEAAESWHVRKHGPSYREAHQAAQRRYPRPDELWTQE